MSTIWLLTVGMGLAGVGLYAFCRIQSGRRIDILRSKGMTITAKELAESACVKAVLQLGFGYGPELWAIFDDEPKFDRRNRTILNGKRILPDQESKVIDLGSWREKVKRVHMYQKGIEH